ncbi:MAG: glycosyltransferase family 4 protein, partial [bacterium]|nr:glycosyltransferase family 4 protein [bacterium]
EGMASGKAIVATDVGGSSELIVDERNGLLIPPDKPELLAQAIIRSLRHESLRDTFGKACRQRVKTLFNINNMIERLETLYVDLATAHQPQKPL